jgi:predicted NUDIX family NTP pyrophosphohydrolase
MQSFGFVIIKIVFKVVYIWVLEKDINEDTVVSNLFEIEWPPTATTTDLGNWLNRKLVLYLE